MSVDFTRFVATLASRYGGRVIYSTVEQTSDPEPGPLVDDLGLDARLAETLKSRGISRLYRFQAEALKEIKSGRDTVIVAGTGTGKTEAFLIPVLDGSLKKTSGLSAVIIYPTKALARDQLARIRGYVENLGLRVEAYDGDTPEFVKRRILRDPPEILLTNPDMMHFNLIRTPGLRDILRTVSYIVFDELHLYSGVFGSHVKWVVFRLLRYAREATLIGSGATIGNPERHGFNLFGREVAVIYGPRRRRGEAWHYFVDCGSASRWSLATRLASAFSKSGLKTLVFVDSQQMAERLARSITREGVKAYVHRAGLPPEYRMMVEELMREGRADVVVATPTLELGIDVGVLDAAMLVGLPSNFAKYIQRAGRVGRRNRPGVILTLLGDNPIESYFAKRPSEYFTQDIPPVFIEPGNPVVARLHLAALLLEAGFIREDEVPVFARTVLEKMVKEGAVIRSNQGFIGVNKYLSGILKESPGLRSLGPQVTIVNEKGEEIGFREFPHALYELHPGAVYLHMGVPYLVASLNLKDGVARVVKAPQSISYYTQSLHTAYATPLTVEESRKLGSVVLNYGLIDVEVVVEGYLVKDEETGETLSEVMLMEPLRWRYVTKGIYGLFPRVGMSEPEAIKAYHALEHILIDAGKPVAGYGETDVAGVSYPSGLIVIYDVAMGGNGATKTLLDRIESAAEIARKILSECKCEDGCPKCVYSHYCGNNNQMLSRRGALKLLEAVLRGEEQPGEIKIYGTPIA